MTSDTFQSKEMALIGRLTRAQMCSKRPADSVCRLLWLHKHTRCQRDESTPLGRIFFFPSLLSIIANVTPTRNNNTAFQHWSLNFCMPNVRSQLYQQTFCCFLSEKKILKQRLLIQIQMWRHTRPVILSAAGRQSGIGKNNNKKWKTHRFCHQLLLIKVDFYSLWAGRITLFRENVKTQFWILMYYYGYCYENKPRIHAVMALKRLQFQHFLCRITSYSVCC